VHSNVFAGGGRLLASYEGPAGTDAAGYHYHLTDWLGTKRMQTTALGNQEETCMSYPFGDGLSCIPPGSDGTEHHYTQKERDIESGLDYFFARYFTSDLVRFMTPDFDDDNEDDPEPVPYAVLGNPQSLNLYAYVGDNPNSGIDLDGHVGGGGSDDATEDEDSEAANSEGQAAGPATQDEGFDFAAGPSGSGSGSDSEETSSSVATSGGWSADQNVKPSNWVFIPGVGWGQLHGWHGENTWYECVSCGNHLPERGRGGGPFSALNNDKMLPPGTLIGITKTCLYASQISDQFGGYAKTDAAIATGIGTAGTLSKATSFLGKYAPEVALIFGVSAGVEGTVSYVSGQVAKGNCP